MGIEPTTSNLSTIRRLTAPQPPHELIAISGYDNTKKYINKNSNKKQNLYKLCTM